MIQRIFFSHKHVYLFAIVMSLVLSAWIAARQAIINPDAICYLLSAQKFAQSGLHAAMNLCGQARWPFFPVLIHYAAVVTHFNPTMAAYILDSLFSVLSVLVFIQIVKTLGGQTITLWLAALLFLLSHELNSVRQYVVRDHGFWAFYLASIFFLLRFFHDFRWRDACGWLLSLIIATLFRVEGILFLVFLPFTAFALSSHSLLRRVQTFLMLSWPGWVAVVIGIVGWLTHNHLLRVDHLGRISEVAAQFQTGFGTMFARFQQMKFYLAQDILSTDSAHEAGLVLAIVMLIWYLLYIIKTLSAPYAFLCLYGLKNKSFKFQQHDHVVLCAYIAINVLITVCFFAQHVFLSARYVTALAITCMILVPFALHTLIDNKTRFSKLLCTLIICAIIFASAGGIINFGYSKAYIRDAGFWMQQHIPPSAKVYANDYQLMYYSHHYGDKIFQELPPDVTLTRLAQQGWRHYDYLALRINKHSPVEKIASTELSLQPIITFANKRGDRVSIYKISHEEKIN